MEDEIYPDEVVLVNKLSYKFQSIKSGDVLVSRLGNGEFVAKRCIARPGEIINLIDGDVYINGARYDHPLTVKMDYLIHLSGRVHFYNFIDSLKVKNIVYKISSNEYHGNLSKKEVNAIRTIPHVEKIANAHKQTYHFFLDKLYPNWTMHSFGPLVVPKKGMNIELNKNNYMIYRNLLRNHEQIIIEEINGKYYVDRKEIKRLILKNDYYFLMGDNRETSVDSRSFGFIPESLIVGRVNAILFSRQNGRFQWNRFLKVIN